MIASNLLIEDMVVITIGSIGDGYVDGGVGTRNTYTTCINDTFYINNV